MSRKGKIKTKLIDIHRDETGPANRVGRSSTGLYPEISRTKLARQLGCSVSKVSYILSGRYNCVLEMAVVLSEALGLEVGELHYQLKVQREEWEHNEQVKRAVAAREREDERRRSKDRTKKMKRAVGR